MRHLSLPDDSTAPYRRFARRLLGSLLPSCALLGLLSLPGAARAEGCATPATAELTSFAESAALNIYQQEQAGQDSSYYRELLMWLNGLYCTNVVAPSPPAGADTGPPTVGIVAPMVVGKLLRQSAPVQITAAGTFRVEVIAEDDTAVQRVELYDHRRDTSRTVQIASTTTRPFVFDIPVTEHDNGEHYLIAVAHDAARYAYTVGELEVDIESDPGPIASSGRFLRYAPGLGSLGDLMLSGSLAYAASDVFGLSIADVSGFGDPRLVGVADVPFAGSQVAVASDRTVVLGDDGAGHAHVWVLESAGAEAVLRGELSTTVVAGNVQDVALTPSGALAVLALGSEGLWVVDVSNASQPRVLDTYATAGFAFGVTLDATGQRAYVADGPKGLEIVDLSVPSSLRRLGGKDFGGVLVDVSVQGSQGLALNQQGTLQSLELSSPSLPVLQDTVLLGAFGTALAVEGTRAAVVTKNSSGNELVLFNVSNRSALRETGRIFVGPPGTATSVVLRGSEALVGTTTDGLLAYAVGGSSPVASGDLVDTFAAQAADGTQELALVAGEDLETATVRLKTVDVSGASLSVVGELSTSVVVGNLQDVAVNAAGTRGAVAMGSQGVWVVELSPHSAPVVQSVVQTPGFAFGVALSASGDRAYVADGPDGLSIVDLSNPRSPRTLGSLDPGGVARDVVVSGTTAFVLNQQGTLQVMDVSDASSPRLLKQVLLASVGFGLAVEGSLAVVLTSLDDPHTSAGYSALQVFDVSSPTNPVSRSVTSLGPAGLADGVTLVDGRAYVAASEDGVQVWDLSSPSAPRLEDSGWIVGAGRSITTRGSLLFVADSAATISVVDLSVP